MEFPGMEDYSCNHAFDLSNLREQNPTLAFLPKVCFLDVNPVSLAILKGDISMLKRSLERGADANGITDKGYPFFSPFLLNSILHLSDWEKERSIIEILMTFPIDINMISLCGINLLHFFILESILFPQNIFKLEWWSKFPMVDVNSPLILYSGKQKRLLEVYHPVEWIQKTLIQKNIENKEYIERQILNLLFARGASTFYGGSDFLSHDPLSWDNPFLKERLFCQWDVQSLSQLKYRIKNKDSFDSKIQEKIQSLLYEQSGVSPTFTLNMNSIETIPSNHCLDFFSSSGKTFSFHASFLESIFKKHIYPFTGENISQEQIKLFLSQTQEKFYPREEFSISQIQQDYPKSLNSEKILPEDRFEFALQKLTDWVSCFYPYTRIFQLKKRPEIVFKFLFKEMNRGDFTFQSFEKFEEGLSWRDQFYWACHESLSDTFILSNRLEELIGLLELNDLFPKPFHEKFPFARMFIESDWGESPLFKLYQEEYDLSFLQLFYNLKHMSIEIN